MVSNYQESSPPSRQGNVHAACVPQEPDDAASVTSRHGVDAYIRLAPLKCVNRIALDGECRSVLFESGDDPLQLRTLSHVTADYADSILLVCRASNKVQPLQPLPNKTRLDDIFERAIELILLVPRETGGRHPNHGGRHQHVQRRVTFVANTVQLAFVEALAHQVTNGPNHSMLGVQRCNTPIRQHRDKTVEQCSLE